MTFKASGGRDQKAASPERWELSALGTSHLRQQMSIYWRNCLRNERRTLTGLELKISKDDFELWKRHLLSLLDPLDI